MSPVGISEAICGSSFPRVSGDEPHDGYQVEHAG